MDQVIGEFLAATEKLPPEERADIHQAFFDKYLKPRWQEMSPEMRQVLPQVFMGSTKFPEGNLQTWQPKNFHERTLESAGGGFRNPLKGGLIEGGLSALHDAALPVRYPLRAAGEAIDTLQYGDKQRPQPKAIGPGSVIPQTTGGKAAEAPDWALMPKMIGALLRVPGMAGRVLGRLNEFGGNVQANRAAAALENTGAAPAPPSPSPYTGPGVHPSVAPRMRVRYGPNGPEI